MTLPHSHRAKATAWPCKYRKKWW